MSDNIGARHNDMKNPLRKWVHGLDKEMRLTVLSIFVGIMGGISAILFRRMSDFVHYVFFDYPRKLVGHSNPIMTVMAPAIGGLMVGYLIQHYADGKRDFDGPEMIKAVNVHGGLMSIRITIIKFITSALTIGSGGSTGREAPIGHFGGGLASYLSQILSLSHEERKTLVIAGVSAGIAATFNSPVGGALYGLEIVRKDQHSYPVIPLLVSSAVGTAIGREYFGPNPAFKFPEITTRGFIDFPGFIAMGFVLGILAAIWVYWFYFVGKLSKTTINPILLAGLGGLIIGIVELGFPDVNGYSYSSVDETFALQKSLETVLLLGIARSVTTALTVGSGGSGGVFAPTFIIGSLFGTAFGYIYVYAFHLNKELVTVFALVGMAAFLAATVKAPLTAIIMTSEMVNHFALFIPLMLCVITAYFTSYWFKGEDLYTLQLKRDNILLRDDYDLLEEIPVSEIMVEPIFVSPKDRLESVLNTMKKSGHTGFPVAEDGMLVGIITEHDVDKAIDTKPLDEWIVSEICEKNVISVIKECPLSVAFMKMAESGINRFPVIDSRENHQLVGWITRSDVMRAYRRAKTDIRFWQEEDILFQRIHSGVEVSDNFKAGFE